LDGQELLKPSDLTPPSVEFWVVFA
jgi:hypothetical protein